MLDVTHVLEFVVNVSISALFLNAILSYRFTVVTDYSLRATVKRSRPEVLPFFLTLGAYCLTGDGQAKCRAQIY